jgi:hypothetical protein
MRTIMVFVAPVDVVQALDDVLAGLLLVVRRDGILAVEEDDVGLAGGGLLEHAGIGAGHGQLRAVQARGGLLNGVETHCVLLDA